MRRFSLLFLTFIILITCIDSAQADSGQIIGKIIPFSVSYSPDLTLSDEGDSTRTFSVAVSQNATFEWYFNGNSEKTDTNMSYSNYTKKAGEGNHNITVIISNENGSVSVTWSWTITKEEEQSQPSRRSGGGGGASLLYILPTPSPTPSSSPTPIITTSTTIVIQQPSTPTPTPESETPEPLLTETPEEEVTVMQQQMIDFSYGTEFFKWFRSVLMVSSSFVLAYFGRNSIRF